MKILQYFIDFIFPPTKEELVLRDFSPEKFYNTASRSSSTEFPFISAIFSYKDPLVREMIWQIKYKKNMYAVRMAGLALCERLRGQNLTLIPIPISEERRKERGYNQSELIIDEIIKLNKEFKKDYSLLRRSRHIERQTLKNKNERIENAKNIFEIIRKPLQGERIIIIDDVTTTGSTLREAKDALEKAGFMDVRALSVAH